MAPLVFMIFSWVSALILLIVGGYLLLQALTMRRPDFPMGSPWGIPIEQARVSDEAWRAAHSAAWPLVGAAGLICTLHGLGIAITLLCAGKELSSLALVLIVMGLVTAALLQWLARSAAKSAALAADKSSRER